MKHTHRVDPAVAAELSALVRAVPDFPQPGVVFRDISQVLRQRFDVALGALQSLVGAGEWSEIDAIAGVDARGFILAAGLAARVGKGFIPVRKSGKLPPPVDRIEYELEYACAALEMQRGEGRLLLVDDVLATGGTLRAAVALSESAGFSVVGVLVLVDVGLAPAALYDGYAVRSVIRY